MSPPSKISRKDVIETAFDIVRKHGWKGFSSRELAKELRSSTMPIYSQFGSMAEIELEVVRKAMELLAEYESYPHTGVLALNQGIGYVLFAWEEPNLFAAINDRQHIRMQTKYGDLQFDQQVEELSRNPRMQGYSNEQLRSFQFLAWVFVHGIASMKNFMDETQRDFSKESLIELIRDGSKTLTHGFLQIQPRITPREKKKDRKERAKGKVAS